MKDKFTKKAFAEGYLARSVYKLKDIQGKFRLMKKGDNVLDIGAAPGSWTQYAVEVGAEVDGVDLNKFKVKGAKIIVADIMPDSIFEKIKKSYDVIISDAAPQTTGILDNDTYNSLVLSSRSLEIVKKVLKKDGKFVCKIFQGKYYEEFWKEMNIVFKKVKTFKPVASRKKSKEIYLIGLNKL